MPKKPSGHVPAGGAFSSKKRKVGVSVGPRSTEKVNPAAVAQLGTKIGSAQAVEPLVAGSMKQVPLGNEVAKNVGSGGPGKGRTLYGQSGSQAQHGPAAGSPRPEATPWYNDFPPKPNNG